MKKRKRASHAVNNTEGTEETRKENFTTSRAETTSEYLMRHVFRPNKVFKGSCIKERKGVHHLL